MPRKTSKTLYMMGLRGLADLLQFYPVLLDSPKFQPRNSTEVASVFHWHNSLLNKDSALMASSSAHLHSVFDR